MTARLPGTDRAPGNGMACPCCGEECIGIIADEGPVCGDIGCSYPDITGPVTPCYLHGLTPEAHREAVAALRAEEEEDEVVLTAAPCGTGDEDE